VWIREKFRVLGLVLEFMLTFSSLKFMVEG
jgi:hypothetical protein